MTKREKLRKLSIASWNLAGLKMKDASDILIHTQMEMPWDIICLQEVFTKTDKLDCGANCVFFGAPKMLGALRAPAMS